MAGVDDERGATIDVDVQDHGGTIVLVLRGEVDLTTAGRVRDAVDVAVTDPGRSLVFDLDAVSFMDSSGVAVLLAAAERAPRIEVRAASPIVRRILETTGVTEIVGLQAPEP
jgi:anti-sigma B factor antagonist